MSDLVLNYRDVEIYSQEFQTISDGCCLGDMVMSFQLRILEEAFASATNSLFLLPCTIQFFQRFAFEDILDTLDSFQLANYRYVFLPISDVDVRHTDASHWSLLYVDRSSGLEMKHFDSHHQKNADSGQRLADILARYWSLPQARVDYLDCPTQTNCYDCGVYVVAYIDKLLESDGDHRAACAFLTPEFITQYRKNVRAHILAMAENS
jgi:sentrin-specific protease 8